MNKSFRTAGWWTDDFEQEWAQVEAQFVPELNQRLALSLSALSGIELWAELQARIELNRALFRRYFDPQFFRVRRQAIARLRQQLAASSDSTQSVQSDLACLLSSLGTRTPAMDTRDVLRGEAVSVGRASGPAYVVANPLQPPVTMPPGSVVVSAMLTPEVVVCFFRGPL